MLPPPWLSAMEHTSDREEGAWRSMTVLVFSGLRPDLREAKTEESGGESSQESYAESKFQKSTWSLL